MSKYLLLKFIACFRLEPVANVQVWACPPLIAAAAAARSYKYISTQPGIYLHSSTTTAAAIYRMSQQLLQ